MKDFYKTYINKNKHNNNITQTHMNNIFFDDNDTKLMSDVQKFLPIVEKQWKYTSSCQSCNSVFGNIINRQHHCRSCGKSFCWDCCHNMMILPKDLIEFPKEEETYQKKINKLVSYVYNIAEKTKKVICNGCHSKLLNFNKFKINIHMLEFCDFNTILNIATLSKNYYYASIYWIFQFKKIQYISRFKFTTWELNMLNDNSKYFNEHNSWIKACIRGFLYEKYDGYKINKKTIITVENIIKNLSNNKNIDCKNIYCSLKCKHNINIYDLIEIFENILYCEINYKNLFWENYGLRSIIKIIIQKSNQSNNQMMKKAIPIFIKCIVKLLNTIDGEDNESKIDLDFLFVIFDFLMLEQKKIYYIMNELEILKHDENNENGVKNFIYSLEKYVEKRKIVVSGDSSIAKKIRDFTVNIYYNNNLTYINSILPIPYYFDLDMEITHISDVIKYKNNKNNNSDSGIIIFSKVKYLIDDNLKEKNVKLLIKKVNNTDEYYLNNLFKILNDKIYSYNIKLQCMIPEMPICDMMMISKNFSVWEITDDSNFLSDLYYNKMSIKNYVYENNLDKTVEKMIKIYSTSLSYFCAIVYIFNLNIKNYDSILINKKGQLYFCDYGNNIHNGKFGENMYMTRSMIDILGTITGKQFSEFAKKTTELFNIISIHDDFINSYMRLIKENTHFDQKTMYDIRDIRDINNIKILND